MCLGVFLLGFLLYGTLCASRTWLTVSFTMVGEMFNYNLFKIFLLPFLFLFFWDPYNSNVGTFVMVPEVSETVISSFHSFYCILLFRSYFNCFFFQLTNSFFCFRDSAINSFQSIFNFSNCVVCLCLSFNYSRSLLIDSCIFSFLLSRILIIFSIIIPNPFSGSLCISCSFIWTSVSSLFLHLCSISLPFHYFFLTYCVWGLLFPGFKESWILSLKKVELFLPFGFCPPKVGPVVWWLRW